MILFQWDTTPILNKDYHWLSHSVKSSPLTDGFAVPRNDRPIFYWFKQLSEEFGDKELFNQSTLLADQTMIRGYFQTTHPLFAQIISIDQAFIGPSTI